MSSFVDDPVPQFAESDSASRGAETSSGTAFEAGATELKSSTRTSEPSTESKPAQRDLDSSRQLLPQSQGTLDPTPPPNKKAKLGRNLSSEKASTSPPTDLSLLSGPKLAYRLLNVTPSHPRKSFHDLSPEVQKAILQFTLPAVPRVHEIEPGYTSRSIELYYGQVYSLMKVCKRWERTIEELPKVWAHVANVIPLDVVDTYLARSKNEGVEIALFASTARLEPTDGELRGFSKFIDRVERNRQRWMSLVVMDFPAGKGNHLVRALFDPARPAPGLKEVYVGTRNNMPLSPWNPLGFKSAAPNLRVLCVHGVTPDLVDYTYARQLERLHVVNPSWVNTIHLIGVLAINHTIRDLKLVNIKFAIGEERLKQDIEVFNLPGLESFSFSTLDTSAEFGQLFTRLNAPNCTEYDIAVDLDQLRSSTIQSSGATTTSRLEWNLLGFSWQHFFDTLRKRIASNFVYPEGERQWFDWQDIPGTTPIFEWRSGSFADGVAGKGPSFRIRIRTKDRGGVYEWVDLVQKQADELRTGRRLEGRLGVSKENGRTAGDLAP
ncbi:hypothetical protein FRC04_002736 [Tulasnella sp. 424]|nr:hypothetical protein FRC04_002736 [Tulasnella sp. 424]